MTITLIGTNAEGRFIFTRIPGDSVDIASIDDNITVLSPEDYEKLMDVFLLFYEKIKTYECQNCDFMTTSDVNEEGGMVEIRDFWSRVSPGEIVPAGECPHCGALMHLKK